MGSLQFPCSCATSFLNALCRTQGFISVLRSLAAKGWEIRWSSPSKKSQLAERLVLNFSHIRPVISLLCRSFNPNIVWLNTLRTRGCRGCAHVCKVRALVQCIFQLGLSWFVHLDPDPFWEPNQGSGDLSEIYPKSMLPSQSKALMWTKGQSFGCRQIKSGCSGCHCPQVLVLPLARDPHLCCTGG